MNGTDNNRAKVNKYFNPIKKLESEKATENPIILNSLLRLKYYNAMDSLNSEISNKIQNNVTLDIFNNNAITLSSLLSKQNYNGAFTQENLVRKKEQKQTKTIETSGISYHLTDITNCGSRTPINNYNDNIEKHLKQNTNIIENNKNYKIFKIKNKFHSPCFSKKIIKNSDSNGMGGKKNNDVVIKCLRDTHKNNSKKEFGTEINEKIIEHYSSYKRFNDFNDKSLNKIKIEEILVDQGKEKEKNIINEETKIYKKKAIKNNNNNKNGKIQVIKSNGKKSKDKYELLLDKYRKRVAQQFLLYFKPYYYIFLKEYFQIFISNIKSIKHLKKLSAPKKYIKKINKRNINHNRKVIKDLKLTQFNSINYNYSNTSIHATENSNNHINSYNSKKIFSSEKDIFNPSKKKNYFLINNNNINFSTKDPSKDKELYRNNTELEKKYIQILQRKRRKKKENSLNSHIYRDKTTIDISSLYTNKTLNNNNTICNNSYDKDYKIINTPHVERFMNQYNSISNGDMSKELTKKNKRNIIKIKSIPRGQKEKERKLKEIILNDKLNVKYESPGISKDVPGSQKRYAKKYFSINSFIKPPKKPKKNRIIIITRKKEKINNVNIYRYNNNFFSKKIKNISTRDKKINIHINYALFIPIKNKYKINLEKINKSLDKSNNYSYTFIGNKNVSKNKIYAKKELTAIKEEEEKSRCSLSLMQNTKKIDENY